MSQPLPAAGPAGADRPAPPSPSEVLVAIWQRVLGREPVGVDADLFALGGTWFDAARAAWLVEDAFDVDLEPAALASRPTPAGVAGLLQTGAGGGPRTRSPGPRPVPVAASQEGMVWHERLRPGSFNLAPLVRRLRGPLDHRALAHALAELARRHEPLRSAFPIRRGRAVQVVREAPEPELPVVDLSRAGAGSGEDQAHRLVTEAAGRPFDLAGEPLFQPSLVRLGPEDHLLVVRLHHTVFDDWSVGVYRRELSALYAALRAGQPAALGEVGAGFTEVVRDQRRRMAGPAGAAELAWWKAELSGAPLTTQVDVGDPSGKAPSGPSNPVPLVVPADLATRLRALAGHGRATLFMALLAAFQVLLHRRTGEDDLLLATVVANRDRRALEGLIGCFTKKVPLRLRLAGDLSFLELVGQVRDALLGALSHHELGYETVLQEVLGAPAAAHGVVPHVPVMFQGLAAPPGQLRLPGLATLPFASVDTQGPGLHVVGPEPDPGSARGGDGGPAWGPGLYPGTFLGISVLDDGRTVTCVAQGGFHPPAVSALLEEYRAVLEEVVAAPLRPVGGLVGSAAGRRGRAGRFRGFPFEPDQLEEDLSACPGAGRVEVAVETAGAGGRDAVVVARAGAQGTGPAPTLDHLRIWLWSRRPGALWPARLEGAATRAPGTEVGAALLAQEQTRLASWWAGGLGLPEVGPEANYWQCFSVLESLSGASPAGHPVSTEQLARHRTIGTLAAELAATRLAAAPSPDGSAGAVTGVAGRPGPEPIASRPGPEPIVGRPGPGPAAEDRPAAEVIRVEGLSKIFASGLRAVENLDLSVGQGEIFGLLGPNGAGKSTTVGMLTTRVIPTAGRAWVAGVDVVADPALAKQYLGVVPQANNLDHSLTVLENLYFHGRYFGMRSKAARATAEDMLERFRLGGRGGDRVDHLSGGMARRLLLARALMQGPAVVFLDEPTAGLDPQSRLALWDIIADLHAEGQTIVLTTHYMEEAEHFCDRVAIMDHGRVLALDTPARLKHTLGSGAVVTVKGEGDLEGLVAALEGQAWASGPQLAEGGLRVGLESTEGALSAVMALAERSGVRVSDVSVSEDSLETVFINLTGRELRE